jgi:hypothetical protein
LSLGSHPDCRASAGLAVLKTIAVGCFSSELPERSGVMIDSIIKIFEPFFRNVTSRLAATAFVLAVFIIAVIWLLFRGSISIGGQDWQVVVGTNSVVSAAILIAIFLLMFFVIWYILYIQYVREAEDIYSYLRKKLEGRWQAEYDFAVLQNYIFSRRPVSNFDFVINASTKKLEMKFDPSYNKIFSSVGENVSQISLRNVEGNKYALMYYMRSERKLADEYVKCILPEYDNQPDIGLVEVEAVGMLDFTDVRGEHIKEMRGAWYDLNGQMRTLGLFLREKMKVEEAGQIYKAKLSSFVDGHIVSAKMGEIIFKFQGVKS